MRNIWFIIYDKLWKVKSIESHQLEKNGITDVKIMNYVSIMNYVIMKYVCMDFALFIWDNIS